MSWNFDISSAPRDRQIMMRTSRDGDKVFVTNWLEPTKHCPNGRFNGFPENAKSLLAWCEIPEFENSPETVNGETGMVLGTGRERPLSIGLHTDGNPEARFESDSLHQSDGDAIAAVKGNARLADRIPVESSLSDRQYLEKIADQVISKNHSPSSHSYKLDGGNGEDQRGAGAVESVCPALIDDVGGE